MDFLPGALCRPGVCTRSPPSSRRAPLNPHMGLLGHSHPPRHRTPPPPSTRPGPRGQQNHGARKGPEPTGVAVPGAGTKQVDATSRCGDGLRRKGGVPAQAPSAHKGPSDLIEDALPSPSPRPGPHPLCALPTGWRPPATPCPVTGSGRPSLCALTGPVLKPGLDPGSSYSPHPPTRASTSPNPDAGTHPFSQCPPPPGPCLPGPQLYLPSEHQPTRAPRHGAAHSQSPSRPRPLRPRPHQGCPPQAQPPRVCSAHLKAAPGRRPSLEGQDLLQGQSPHPGGVSGGRGPNTLAGPGRPRADLAQGGMARSPQSWVPASSLLAGRGALSAQSAFQGSRACPPPSSHSGQPGFMTSQAEVTQGQCWAFHTSKCRSSLARRLPAVLMRTMPAGPRGVGM